MKEGEGRGIMKWLAIVITIIIIVLILALVILLPVLIDKVKADTGPESDFMIDLQVGNQVAIMNLPKRLTEFKQNRELVQVELIEAPFISQAGQTMIAVRDLNKLFPAQIEWCPKNHGIKIVIPGGIISKTKIIVTLTDQDYLLKNNRAFISIRTLSASLKASEIIWISETQGVRIIWYN